ncbi:MAG: 50S ribosomal protein L3 [Chloroflexi bacterium]|nr:50S ribosomal protein L3 [Chloroflexota bacterium]
MIQGIIGKKLGMTQVYEGSNVQAVTAIQAGPCMVTQVKTEANDGYNAVQLGFGAAKHITSPEKGHLKDLGELKYLREFRVDDIVGVERGQKLDAGLFKAGDLINVTGISKGKGFAGGVKRYHFRGGPKTHGQSDRHRAPGSVGATTSPGHTWRGQRMAGHMGVDRVTVRGLKVIRVDPERNLLLVGGAVPGADNGLLMIKKVGEAKKVVAAERKAKA